MASLPPQLIPGSDIENGFLAHLIVSKYLGLPAVVPTGADRAAFRGGTLAPEAVPLVRRSRQPACAHCSVPDRDVGPKSLSWMADETFVNGARSGAARQGAQGVAVGLPFFWKKSRRVRLQPFPQPGQPPEVFPSWREGRPFDGRLQRIPAVLAQRPGLVHACCWAHARRGF